VLAGLSRPSWHRGWPAGAIPEAAAARPADRLLGADETAAWLRRMALPAVAGRLTGPAGETADEAVDEAVDAARGLGFPVCVKGVLPGVVHKSSAGLVRLGLNSADAVRSACAQIAARAAQLGAAGGVRFEVQQMLDVRAELMLGMTRDPIMGPVLTIGAGGTAVEEMADVRCLLPPVTPAEVAHCVTGLRAGDRLLGAAAGPAEREAVLDLVAGFSRMISEDDSLAQVDLNPVVLTAAGEVKVVDAVVAVVDDGAGEPGAGEPGAGEPGTGLPDAGAEA
jgi:ATP-grasp domain